MDDLLYLTNRYVVDPMLGHSHLYNYMSPDQIRNQFGSSIPPWQPEYSMLRQTLVLWAFLYINSYLIYIIFASITYKWFYTPDAETGRNRFVMCLPQSAPTIHSHSHLSTRARWDKSMFQGQISQEIWTSTWSLFIMSGMTMPVELLSMYGYGFVYHDVAEYGILYLILSPFLFLVFTDSLIYWIHRWLHHPKIYWVCHLHCFCPWYLIFLFRQLHKLHHKFKHTTPYSAFSFHPLDGYAQGLPYHLFPLVFPFHNYMYAFSLFMVGLWTINIHDRVTFNFWGVNSSAHHTVHHTKFNYNFGQYFTFWFV